MQVSLAISHVVLVLMHFGLLVHFSLSGSEPSHSQYRFQLHALRDRPLPGCLAVVPVSLAFFSRYFRQLIFQPLSGNLLIFSMITFEFEKNDKNAIFNHVFSLHQQH